MKKFWIYTLMIVIVFASATGVIYSLTKADKEELIKEVTNATESDQFLVNAFVADKITNIHFKREENLFGEFDLYGDAYVSQMYDNHHLNCGVSCCDKYWEKIEITPVTKKFVHLQGTMCYKIITNEGIHYHGTYTIACELRKKDDVWHIK
ncbi:MAG: hypothetical protein KQH79_05845 [Bacteroidetes bacterium]|nr:hypothetical protein [Bacteroidota bacterium]